MSPHFPEFVVGGVLIAPFVPCAVAALVIFLLLRPVLYLVGFERAVRHPPLAALCLYVVILAIVVLFW